MRTAAKKSREKTLAPKLRRIVRKLGGWAVKVESPGVNGRPDYDVFLKGHFFAVETKSFGKKPDPEQVVYHRKLRRQLIEVRVLSNESELSSFKKELQKINRLYAI